MRQLGGAELALGISRAESPIASSGACEGSPVSTPALEAAAAAAGELAGAQVAALSAPAQQAAAGPAAEASPLAGAGPGLAAQQRAAQQPSPPAQEAAAGGGMKGGGQRREGAGASATPSAFLQAFRARHGRGACTPLAPANGASSEVGKGSPQPAQQISLAADCTQPPPALPPPALEREPAAQEPALAGPRRGAALSNAGAHGGGTRASLSAVIMAVEDELGTLDLR